VSASQRVHVEVATAQHGIRSNLVRDLRDVRQHGAQRPPPLLDERRSFPSKRCLEMEIGEQNEPHRGTRPLRACRPKRCPMAFKWRTLRRWRDTGRRRLPSAQFGPRQSKPHCLPGGSAATLGETGLLEGHDGATSIHILRSVP